MNGIIIINKSKGYTSHDVVNKVKRLLGEKVGHTGTLDPNATGVLPLLVGKGTQASKYLINHDKVYEVVLKLGEKTDTADSEGNILKKQEVKEESLKKDNIEKVFKEFLGKQEQKPPIYSAIKVNGKKLYEYARRRQTVEIQPRKIEIYTMELESINKQENEIFFKVSCSKGTYIRSLCEDIATKLNTLGFMKELNRVQVGNFNIENSVTIEELENNYTDINFLNKYFIQLEQIFKKCNFIKLENRKLKLFLNGVCLTYKYPDAVYRIYGENNEFIGTGIIKENLLKRDIII